MTSIKTSATTDTTATFVVTGESVDFTACILRDGTRTISIINGQSRSANATAAGMAKRLDLASLARQMFADFDAARAAEKLAAPTPSPTKASAGFDSPIAVASEIPNIAGWVDVETRLAFQHYSVRAVHGGFAWSNGGELNLNKSGQPFRRQADAIYAAQCSRFPDWKTGSFASYRAQAA
jgi:hypothetical protein